MNETPHTLIMWQRVAPLTVTASAFRINTGSPHLETSEGDSVERQPPKIARTIELPSFGGVDRIVADVRGSR
jgi:hypothetical protein